MASDTDETERVLASSLAWINEWIEADCANQLWWSLATYILVAGRGRVSFGSSRGHAFRRKRPLSSTLTHLSEILKAAKVWSSPALLTCEFRLLYLVLKAERDKSIADRMSQSRLEAKAKHEKKDP